MRKLFVKGICVVLVTITLVFSVSLNVSSYSIYTYSSYNTLDNVLLLRNKNQIYLIGVDGADVNVDAVYPESFNICLNLNNNVHAYNLCGDTLVLVCPVVNSSQSEIILYNITSDSFTSFCISDSAQHESTQIAYDGKYVYLSDCDGNIKLYTTKGKLYSEYNTGSNACYLMCDYSDNVYALSTNGMFRVTSDYCTKISSTSFNTAARFVDNDIFTTASGVTYKLTTSGTSKLVDFKNTFNDSGGGIYKKFLISAQQNTIYAISTTNNEPVKSLSLDTDIEQLYVIDNTIVVLTHYNNAVNISIIPYSELKTINTEVYNSISEYSVASDYVISSDVYVVDNNNMTISGIAPSTTVAEFKRNINYDGFEVTFTRYGGQSITSGNVGTATIAKFYNENNIYEYELCVEGDLTGEGNVNTRDESVMFDCLLDNMETFTGVFVQAAKLDSSYEITTADLVLLLRMIESK